MSETVETGQCLCCDEPFTYIKKVHVRNGRTWRSRKKVICPACGDKNLKEQRKTWRKKKHRRGVFGGGQEHHGSEGLASGVFKMTHQQIARSLGLSESAVADIERRVLLKIRNSTGLKELWRSFIEDGCPVPPGGLGEDPAQALLDYQMAVADWWALHDKIAAYGGNDEAVECLREIEKFQRRIGKFLEEAW